MPRSARIPDQWPRGMSAKVAAAYRGVSTNKWLAEVKDGMWPQPETSGGRVIWDRVKIDEAWDQHQSNADPFMEAINAG